MIMRAFMASQSQTRRLLLRSVVVVQALQAIGTDTPATMIPGYRGFRFFFFFFFFFFWSCVFAFNTTAIVRHRSYARGPRSCVRVETRRTAMSS